MKFLPLFLVLVIMALSATAQTPEKTAQTTPKATPTPAERFAIASQQMAEGGYGYGEAVYQLREIAAGGHGPTVPCTISATPNGKSPAPATQCSHGSARAP